MRVDPREGVGMDNIKTVTLAQLTERFGLSPMMQQGVYAWTNAHGDPSGDSPLWTEAEAAELLEVWQDAEGGIGADGVTPQDLVQVEYHAEGGETIHEPNLFVDHSMCGEPGYYCPTGEHANKPYTPDWQMSHEKFRNIN
jgi:hypothetical protein